MKKKILYCIIGFTGTLLLSATNGFSYGSYGSSVNNICGETVYTGDCTFCHTTASKADPTPAKDAFLAGGTTLADYFCSTTTTPTCTDNDGDTFAVEGGDCGPIDCNDDDAGINPGATENCSDGFDNNCNGLVDEQDLAAVGCQVCTDNDGDGYSVEGGNCGPVDCDDGNGGINPGASDLPDNGIDENCDGFDSVDTSVLDNDGDGYTPETGDCDDTDGAVYPGSVEICTDGIDNDCNGQVDTQDPNAVDCPQTCTDNDADTFAAEGGTCGPVDCDDIDATINPGVQEICDDGIDNDCDGSVDEGCEASCPDVDADGYQDAACGGTDCNDNDAAINPGAAEISGNGIDENCNGASDDVVLTCPDGTLLVVKKVDYNPGKGKLRIEGRATVGTTISIINTDTGETLADGIKVRGGKWRANVGKLGSDLENITVFTSNGCAIDQSVGADVVREYREDDGDHQEGDHKNGRHDRHDR